MKKEKDFVFGYNPTTDRFKMSSCCGDNHSGGGHSHHSHGSSGHHNHGNTQMSGSKYQCPMKCEGEKTYDSPGNCPVCNMKLAPVS